jgi:hypothetical protein
MWFCPWHLALKLRGFRFRDFASAGVTDRGVAQRRKSNVIYR